MLSSRFPLSTLARDLRIRAALHPFSTTPSNAMDSARADKAVVRIFQDSENLTITLTIADRIRNLNRPKKEELRKSLNRLRLSLFPNKRKDMKQVVATSNVMQNEIHNATVALYNSRDEMQTMDEGLSNENAWSNASWLIVGHYQFEVLTNPPEVMELSLEDKPIVDHSLYPLCKVQSCNASDCRWRWFRKREEEGTEWEELEAETRVYTPVAEDGGCWLGVECTPVSPVGSLTDSPNQPPRIGEAMFKKIERVSPLPSAHSGDGRHHLTPSPMPAPFFRIVTYNVLADSYVSRPNYEGIPQCSMTDRNIDRRKQLILRELLGYHADIICLQECDDGVFDSYYSPHLHLNGFMPLFSQKNGTTKEGEAIFVRNSKFKVIDHQKMCMNQILEAELPPYLKPFKEMISKSKNMRNALKAVVTIGQITLLEPKNGIGKHLCIINTHLISKGYGEHIRMFHVLSMLHKAKETAQEHGVDAEVLLVGDLNSSLDHETGFVDGILHDACPNQGSTAAILLLACVTLLRDGVLSSDHWEWEDCKKFNWKRFTKEDDISLLQEAAEEGDRDPIEGIDLELPFEMETAMDLSTPYTNYTAGFKGLLDYVWYEPKAIECVRTIPIPAPEQLGGPCPSTTYPSDHLAVVVELKYKQSGGLCRVLPASIDNVSIGVQEIIGGKVIGKGFLISEVEGTSVGACVGVPTDTIYGLAADAGNTDAIKELYKIKGRSGDKPLSICVQSIRAVATYGDVRGLPLGLLEALLPGPITIILDRLGTSTLSPELNPGLSRIGHPFVSLVAFGSTRDVVEGIRVPTNDFTRQLCVDLDTAIALTSANLSGQRSSVCVEDFRPLWDSCGAVFDAGHVSTSYLGSTVVDLSTPTEFRLLRRGDGCTEIIETLMHYGLTENAN